MGKQNGSAGMGLKDLSAEGQLLGIYVLVFFFEEKAWTYDLIYTYEPPHPSPPQKKKTLEKKTIHPGPKAFEESYGKADSRQCYGGAGAPSWRGFTNTCQPLAS